MANMAGNSVIHLLVGALLGVLACWSTTPHAQMSRQVSSPLQGERLSGWLLRQPNDQRAYPNGLLWQVPAERIPQAGLKRELLVWLSLSEVAPVTSRENLASMIKALPVTGRVPVPLADARWLQAHPKEDPVLHSDHVLVLPQRPSTVSVITNNGKRCTLLHQAGAEARDYVKACEPKTIERIDHVWVAQPDGAVRDFGIAPWNAQAQDEAAPGALIWAPARDTGWSPQFSALFTQFLATQGYDSMLSVGTLESFDTASAVVPGGRARDAVVTANDWGLIGLLQTPTARMAPSGEARFTYSNVYPINRNNVIFQPLDWMEGGFRYTTIRNRLYGDASLSGTQEYLDKSFDLKVRLNKETASLPEVAVGITDLTGTGLYSSEYLVANKRSGNFDWSLGMGWGYMAGSGNISNPLSLLGGKSFDTRVASGSTTGGQINSATFFHGSTALFGGVQYHTPSEKWLFKAEYDGNNYQHEPQNNNRTQKTPVNVGLVYRFGPSIDLSAGIERGTTLMLGLTFKTSLPNLNTPKVSDQPMPLVVASRPTEEPIWTVTAADINALTGWSVRQISREGDILQVVLDQGGGAHWNDRIERVTAVLHRDAPAAIYEFDLVFIEQGIPMTKRVILREPWVKQRLQFQVMSERFQAIDAAEPRGTLPTAPLWESISGSPFGYSIVPSWQQNLGGPDGFLLFRAGVSTPMRLKLSEDTSITAVATLGLVDNYGKFKYTAPSNLPRVRTYLREYMTTSELTLPNLQLTHMGSLNNNQYFSVYGGLLETMFAGVGGEWLYRPWHSPFAFGIDINRVQQRNFQQNFGFDDAGTQTGYRVTTGHATAYWDTGWKSTEVKLSVGKYLAGDLGATLDIGRTFNNGISIGAWATKTNVSAEQFGEGSFDKGIYLRIPFDVIATTRGGGVANLAYAPLTRDGGARLNRSVSLYGSTDSRSDRHTSYAPSGPRTLGERDDDIQAWGTERSLATDLAKAGMNLGAPDTRGKIGNALWLGGGIVLASSLLDRPLANWADKHQSDRWNNLGKMANNVPLLLAAGTGMLWWGMAGENASETAWTAIKSATLTVGAETVGKVAINRARPEAGLGAAHFDPFGKGSANSSFPSVHMGTAFALVTPFAQDYNAPWLYAIAGATAFGRIQQRQHFASDIVAGSLMGYATGTLLLDQQHRNRKAPRIEIGSNRSIKSTWEF